MSELISGKEALIAWFFKDQDIELRFIDDGSWDIFELAEDCYSIDVFRNTRYQFRLKPRTIMIGDVEVPAPFEPKEGEDCKCYYVNTTYHGGFDWYHSSHHTVGRTAWRSIEEIKQVVAALRKLFKGE